jgi:hypothetical protein
MGVVAAIAFFWPNRPNPATCRSQASGLPQYRYAAIRNTSIDLQMETHTKKGGASCWGTPLEATTGPGAAIKFV